MEPCYFVSPQHSRKVALKLVVETKGDHLDAEHKIRQGNTWAQKAGNAFRFFMVYDRRVVNGAYKLDDFLNVVREI